MTSANFHYVEIHCLSILDEYQPYIHLAINGHGWTENNEKLVPVWCQGPIIPIDIAKEDDTLESDDDVASSSEGEVLSDDSAVAESDSDEDQV